jgi:hypothetical protein
LTSGTRDSYEPCTQQVRLSFDALLALISRRNTSTRFFLGFRVCWHTPGIDLSIDTCRPENFRRPCRLRPVHQPHQDAHPAGSAFSTRSDPRRTPNHPASTSHIFAARAVTAATMTNTRVRLYSHRQPRKAQGSKADVWVSTLGTIFASTYVR